MQWTPEADALLVKLWNEGGSLTTVERDMQMAGYDVSRGMIAGRKHRLPHELFNRPSTPPPPPRMKPPQRSNYHMSHPRIFKDSATPVTKPELEGVEYQDMQDDHCKAILGVRRGPWGLQMVCGKPRCYDANGSRSSYCMMHLRAFTNQPRRA